MSFHTIQMNSIWVSCVKWCVCVGQREMLCVLLYQALPCTFGTGSFIGSGARLVAGTSSNPLLLRLVVTGHVGMLSFTNGCWDPN